MEFVAEAPLVGHGTGTIKALFRRAAGVDSGTGWVTVNPHSQVFRGGNPARLPRDHLAHRHVDRPSRAVP